MKEKMEKDKKFLPVKHSSQSTNFLEWQHYTVLGQNCKHKNHAYNLSYSVIFITISIEFDYMKSNKCRNIYNKSTYTGLLSFESKILTKSSCEVDLEGSPLSLAVI